MKKIELKDFTKYKAISELRVSEDEKHSAFVISTMNYENNKYEKNIFVMDNSTKKIFQLTTMNKEGNFIWLNDNTILFKSMRDFSLKEEVEKGADWSVYYTINIFGGEAKEFMRIPYEVSSIKKIDEKTFALIINYKRNRINLHEFEGNEKIKAEKKLKDEQDYEVFEEIPFWQNGAGFSDGVRERLGICTIISDEEMNIDFITDKSTSASSMELVDGKLLFLGNYFEDKFEMYNSINSYDFASKKTTELYPQKDMSVDKVLYLNGKIIALASDMKDYGLNQNRNFYAVEDGKMELLSEHDNSVGSRIASDVTLGGGYIFKVYKDKLYFINTIAYSSHVASMDVDGNMEILTPPIGSVSMLDVMDEEILFVGLRGSKLQELYSIDRDEVNSEEKQLTFINEEILKDKYISKPEHFSFMNSERIHIDGWVMKPIDFDENKKYPCVLDIHGGPKTAYGEVFFHEMQVWSNEGYFVLFCNPRGGEGRGNDFMDIRKKYGTIDYNDIMEFLDESLERNPQIDVENIGVTGGSYGGFMTNWIIGHTNRFKCAASQRSISNWISKFCTTDIGYFFVEDQTKGNPWEDQESLWKQSPLKYADKCTTPTLFINSDQDYRCYMAEGIQMYTALKYHGVDARLCLFKGETHELSRSGEPKHRERRLLEITNWFNKYLK